MHTALWERQMEYNQKVDKQMSDLTAYIKVLRETTGYLLDITEGLSSRLDSLHEAEPTK